jgi:hypothetical protein
MFMKISSYEFFTNLFVILIGLDPDPDWIRIPQQAESRSGFSKIPGSGYGFGEYGSETMVSTLSSLSQT